MKMGAFGGTVAASKEQLKAQLVRRLQKLGDAVTVEAPAA
jgi:hypothetical protein